ncbi:hypothetical protein HYDPIDRAFT_31748 [Hydnomerulius pinastri MD-312]|uniref:Unplaced genomic scaffold scaffold_32, whole genome shotgun sequence n=1 Tax=Hydnomerulius pinastri MD-312 TaxID=994086 RepID=A0A0C9WBA7_9AGAM|nr:hypothetical protein HYDPIDRAFT_31748 [Hydnomerulius pinastri MD-312]
MSASNNASKGKSVPPADDLTKWADVALAENDSDDEVLAARKFQECQRRRAEKKREEEWKKAEEERKRAEEVKKAEEVRKAVEAKKAEEARKAAEAKKATALTRGVLSTGGGAKCEGCENAGVDCTMEMPGGSKATACDRCHRQKMGCVRPGVEKKESRRKREEPTSPRGGSKRKQMRIRSPEMEDDEEDKDEEDALRLIVKAINGLTQEMKEMRREYREQGKRVVAAIDDLQHMLDPEYVAGPEEESDPEVPEEEVAEASAELGELRKEAEAAAEETEDEESDDEEV